MQSWHYSFKFVPYLFILSISLSLSLSSFSLSLFLSRIFSLSLSLCMSLFLYFSISLSLFLSFNIFMWDLGFSVSFQKTEIVLLLDMCYAKFLYPKWKQTTCLFTLTLWLYDNFLSGINGSNGWRPPNGGGGGVETFAGVTIGAFDTGGDTFVAAELIDKLILLLKFSFVERFKMSVWLFLLQSWLPVLVMLYVSWTMTGFVEGLSDIIEDLIMSGS